MAGRLNVRNNLFIFFLNRNQDETDKAHRKKEPVKQRTSRQRRQPNPDRGREGLREKDSEFRRTQVRAMKSRTDNETQVNIIRKRKKKAGNHEQEVKYKNYEKK